MLRTGIIDETYPNYLTYFYDTSISRMDMNFILAIRNHEGIEYSHPLFNIKSVIEMLNDYEFEQREALNFSLLSYLLKNENDYSIQLTYYMNMLFDKSDESMNFIDTYVEKNNAQIQFSMLRLILLSYYLHHMFQIVLKNFYAGQYMNLIVHFYLI